MLTRASSRKTTYLKFYDFELAAIVAHERILRKEVRINVISGTFTKAVMYLMLLSDSIIAGFFIGETGVAAINAIAPIIAIVTFFGDLGSTGVGIVFAREVGAMRKHRADEIYGQGSSLRTVIQKRWPYELRCS